MSQPVFQQYRSVQIDGTDLSDFDIDVSVSSPKNDPVTFEVTVYNLAESVFAGITGGESAISIELGWENGPQSTVLVGAIENTTREYDGTDVRYTFEGTDASSAVLNSNISMMFKEKTPAQCAEGLAGQVGLGAETDSVSQTIDPYWNAGTHQTVAQWLDELVDLAGQFTGKAWTYWAEAGTLYFVIDDGVDETIPSLSYDGMLVSVNRKSDEKSRAGTVEFVAMLDPRIGSGQQVQISTDAVSGNYTVRSYEFTSNATTGEHTVRATADKVSPPESYSDSVKAQGGGGGKPGERKINSIGPSPQ